MAELHIEKKPRKPIWPWILIIVLVMGLLIWWFLDQYSNTVIIERTEINMLWPEVNYDPEAYCKFLLRA